MSENEIKPVAWVPPTFFDNGVVAATARRKPPSATAVEMRGEYSPLYDQSAIDALTNQISELKTMLSIAEFQRKEMQAERDEANRKLSVAVADGKALVAHAKRYRAVIEYALAQHNYGLLPLQNHWAAKAMSELAAIDAARAEGVV